MICILSPAKRMNRGASPAALPMTTPALTDRSSEILAALRSYDAWQLEDLMKINSELAVEAWMDFQKMALDQGETPALLAYEGLVFRYLDAASLSGADMDWAQEHLRVLSGFYGVLRPLDAIMPYRLEMGTRLAVGEYKDLYRFWQDALYQQVIQGTPDRLILNLASEEYAKAVRKYLTGEDRLIDIAFLENKKGKLKVVTAHAKMARGLMTRFFLENRVEDPAELRSFDGMDYHFDAARSGGNQMVFIKE